MQTVARREIRAASRRAGTYWSRAIAGGVGAVVISALLFQFALGIVAGRQLFFGAINLALLMALLEGVRQAATSIVDERAEGTLGLLLLTEIRGPELLLGKFASLAFFAMQTVLAISPFVATPLLLGGVAFSEVARSVLVIAHVTVISITVGLVISARSIHSSRAMLGVFFTLALGAIVFSLNIWPQAGRPGAIFNAFNPMTPIWNLDDFRYSQFKLEFWTSILFSWTCAALALWLASKKLTADFGTEGKPAKPKPKPAASAKKPAPEIQASATAASAPPVEATAPTPPVPHRRAPRWFNGNPIQWLIVRHLGLHGNMVVPTVLTAIAVGVLFLIQYWAFLVWPILFLIFGFLYSVASTITLARAKQSGELELWLTTPLTIPQIVAGQTAALRKLFIYPGLILLLGLLGLCYLRIVVPLLTGGGTYSVSFANQDLLPSLIYFFASTSASILALIFTLPHIGMWIALKAKTPGQAAFRTFLFIVVLPWLVPILPNSLIYLPIAAVASHSVRTRLKNFAVRER